jgi:hypothetical protein
MSWRLASVVGIALLLSACATPSSYSSRSEIPRTRCLTSPGRSESYAADRPLFFLFCMESP